MQISTPARNAAVDGVVDLLDAGGAGSLKIFTGTIPATPAAADTGTLLATLPLSATAFGAASSGTATAATITSDTSIDATGTAGYWRMYSGAGTCILQGSVGVSGADLNLDSLSFVAGGTVSITSFTVTCPAGT